MAEFPKDDDGAVLNLLAKKGINLTLPREVEFYCYAKGEVVANEIVAEMESQGEFNCYIYKDDEEVNPNKAFSVYMSKVMILNYDNVVNEQQSLNVRLKQFDAFCDGWMTES